MLRVLSLGKIKQFRAIATRYRKHDKKFLRRDPSGRRYNLAQLTTRLAGLVREGALFP